MTYFLWLIIGGIGAHRFYLRKMRSGFLLLGYTVSTTAIDLFALEIWPNADFFYTEQFYWMTVIPLWLILLWDAFQIPRWVREKNAEIEAASVFS